MDKREQRVYRLNIYLMKESVKNIADCIKKDIKNIIRYDYKEAVGIKGAIFVLQTRGKQPEWKKFIDDLCSQKVDLANSTTNKVVFLVKIEKRIMAVVFGYGRTLLDDTKIENDFGIKTALGLVETSKIRSMDAATIESMIILTQQQANYLVDKDEFTYTYDKDIMLSVNGMCSDNSLAQRVTGRDSVMITSQMEPKEIKEKLLKLLYTYQNKKYKTNFSAIDNVRIVKDAEIINALDGELIDKIKNKEVDKITVAPPANIDWDNILGFLITGAREKIKEKENYSLEVDFKQYLSRVPIHSIEELNKRELLCMDNSGETQRACSLYRALTTEITHDNQIYVLFDAKWYIVDNDFAAQVRTCISSINISDIEFPLCKKNEKEGVYNQRVADSNPNIVLGDKIMCNVYGAQRQIESCDLLTKKKQFIHIKKHTKSAMLSHLFSQGRVSAMCFVDDQEYRMNVYNIARKKWCANEADFRRRPEANEIEVIFGVITSKKGDPVDIMPFFSLVNLMITYKDLARMNVKCSLKIIHEEE